MAAEINGQVEAQLAVFRDVLELAAKQQEVDVEVDAEEEHEDRHDDLNVLAVKVRDAGRVGGKAARRRRREGVDDGVVDRQAAEF